MGEKYELLKRNAWKLLKRLLFWGTVLFVGALLNLFVRTIAWETSPDSPTLISLDFLQALAFLVAWSAFLVVAAFKMGQVDNKGEWITRDINRVERDLQERQNTRDLVVESTAQRIGEIETFLEKVTPKMEQLLAENVKLAQEKEELLAKLESQGSEENS